MANTQFHKFKTISEFHQFRGLPKPQHPLISVINLADVKNMPEGENSILLDFYSIALKRNFNAKMKYGQQEYDFDEGIMFFISPGQIFRIEVEKDKIMDQSGWMLLVHPDFLWNTPLTKIIAQSEFFSYSVHEALFLSDKEENQIAAIMQNIQQEYHSNIDQFSQNVMLGHLELILTYSHRYYNRQFITRKISSHMVINRLENILSTCFEEEMLSKNGLPTVQYIAETLNMSPNYLSALLKALTGQSTQQHIHDQLIKIAKEKLSITSYSVSEIAYQLGFEHPQSFNKLFKRYTDMTPNSFRKSFN
ncbi:helix-turn-helix domain-containing protein [Pedobacter sp. MR2016-24]|uniref:helix-turn-helix domain-containing protein n=1 Tax=Pedobacter sp. MR2016-24 TaxID=2994466 RepID=UPI0022470E30|nr:response regulator transcription factor [Pedobacter sp. MR2016-24]MCX2484662.1 helix-turn-helix transcriptional regulator [Pedobacter sp. MR2016-24]